MNTKTFIIALSGFLFCFAMSAIVLMTIILAYLNDMEILVTINRYGEGLFEVILAPLVFIFSCFSLWYFIHNSGVKIRVKQTQFFILFFSIICFILQSVYFRCQWFYWWGIDKQSSQR